MGLERALTLWNVKPSWFHTQENPKCCCLGLGLGHHPSLYPHLPVPVSLSHDESLSALSPCQTSVSCSASRVLGHHNHDNPITEPASPQLVRKRSSSAGTPNALLSSRTPAPLKHSRAAPLAAVAPHVQVPRVPVPNYRVQPPCPISHAATRCGSGSNRETAPIN